MILLEKEPARDQTDSETVLVGFRSVEHSTVVKPPKLDDCGIESMNSFPNWEVSSEFAKKMGDVSRNPLFDAWSGCSRENNGFVQIQAW
jgi:hypothetical protein